jgi:hypothetical protein
MIVMGGIVAKKRNYEYEFVYLLPKSRDVYMMEEVYCFEMLL